MVSWMLPFFYVDIQGEMGSSFPVVMFLNLQPKPIPFPIDWFSLKRATRGEWLLPA